MFLDGGRYGRFINAGEGEGWEVRHNGTRGRLFPESIYQFSLLYPNPLTWYDRRRGAYYRPGRTYSTNLGSTPFFTRPLLPQNEFPRSYAFHDSAWLHGGMLVSSELDGAYEYQKVTLWESNLMLIGWIHAEGGRIRKQPIFIGATIGAAAFKAWDEIKAKWRDLDRLVG